MQHEKSNTLALPRAARSLPREPEDDGKPALDGNVRVLDRWLVRKLMEAVGSPPFSMVLWDGEEVWTPSGKPAARIVIHNRAALQSMVMSPEMGFGDGYSLGEVEVQGDLVRFLETVYRTQQSVRQGPLRRRGMRWIYQPRKNTLFGARENIQHHYDIGNDFYRLWLDARMVYTCAYYAAPDATLEQAQLAKMDHIAHKLELRPGLTVVEAGCGWGALAIHLARHYGVKVRAYNISRAQITFARERAAAEELNELVEFVEDDYRNITGQFDRFVSVGMLEHVGQNHYGELGAIIHRSLKADGRALIHSIGRNRPAPNNVWIERRIFPGSCPPSLSEMMAIFEPWELSVLDVENLRLHYARTCEEWLSRFEAVSDQVQVMFDQDFVRAWRLYLAGSAAAFSVGTLQLFQVVVAPPHDNSVPRTRRHMYA